MKRLISIVLGILLVILETPLAAEKNTNKITIEKVVEDLSFLETTEIAKKEPFAKKEIEKFKKKLEKDEEKEIENLQKEWQKNNKELKDLRERLDKLNKEKQTPEIGQKRKELHCQIKILEAKTNKELYKKIKKEKIRVVYDFKRAKLELLSKWPEEEKKIQSLIVSGKTFEGKFRNVKDIGFRDLGVGDQSDDIELGKRAIEEMKQFNMLPEEFKDDYVKHYIMSIVDVIVKNSDIKIPISSDMVTVVGGKEGKDVNAFAFPGGYIFVNTGLILEVENEAQLAGVISHELSHVAARHGHRLMKRASIWGTLAQIGQIGALILTGGASYAIYYALQGIFTGIGLFINLDLLGVARDFETEADILGMQYMWKSGYDPQAFMEFFNKMSKEKGYASHTSWWRTHPAFVERFSNSMIEHRLLPEKDEDFIVSTSELDKIKSIICARTREEEKQGKEIEKKRPTLRRRTEKEDDCPAPQTPRAKSPCDDVAPITLPEPKNTDKPGSQIKRAPESSSPN